MATGFGTVVLDTPECKIFHFNVDENDPVSVDVPFTFAGGGMTNFDAVPIEKYIQEITPVNTVCTVAVTWAISAISRTGFTLTKTSVDAGNPLDHVFRVYLHARRYYQ